MTDEYIGYKRDLLRERALIFAAFSIGVILTATRFYIRKVDIGMMDDHEPMTIDDVKDLYSVERDRERRNENHDEADDELYVMPNRTEYNPYGQW